MTAFSHICAAATVESVGRTVADLTSPDGFAFTSDHVADAVSGSVNVASRWIYQRARARHLGGVLTADV